MPTQDRDWFDSAAWMEDINHPSSIWKSPKKKPPFRPSYDPEFPVARALLAINELIYAYRQDVEVQYALQMTHSILRSEAGQTMESFEPEQLHHNITKVLMRLYYQYSLCEYRRALKLITSYLSQVPFERLLKRYPGRIFTYARPVKPKPPQEITVPDDEEI